jgi:arginyl-tRNA synthetase
MSLVDRVRASIQESLVRLAQEGALGESAKSDLSSFTTLVQSSPWTVERPKRAEHGDYATNVAMVITKKIGVAPRQIAEALVGAAQSSVIKSAEIAGPGFVNLRIHANAIHQELADIVHLGSRYGRAPAVSGERINIEFVSANPTGPITVAAARNGIYGDAVATLLELTGNRVAREYYINDFGAQIKAFVESVRLAHENKPRGEGHYQGAYIEEIARYLEKRSVDPFKQNDEDLSRTCITTMIHGIPGSALLPGIRKTLSDLGINFDTWFSEESLHRWGNVEVAIEKLRATGFLIEKEGALMFVAKSAAQEEKSEKEKKHRSEEDGRVVKKQNGEWTYFASDIAYHSDKLSRGFDRIINVWGADHHGYIARLKNVLEALGLAKEKSEILIYQLVTILRDGQKVMSSKRAGNIITADEVMDEIDEAAGRKGAGRDALRFFFLSRSANTTVDFDIEIAKKKSLDNPVFYVQYGHARLSSILKKAESINHPKISTTTEPTPEVWAKLDHADELTLAQNLSRWPDLLEEAASLREPHRIVFYVQELARDFQSYFTRMKNDPVLPKDTTRAEAGWDKTWDFDKTNARLAWIRSIRAVYAFALEAIGVSAPDRMDLPESAKDGDDSTDT